MSTKDETLGMLLEGLAQANVVASPAEKPLPAALAPAADGEGSPWYVKALVGVAAWVAAFLLGIFFGLLGIIDTGTQMLSWGIALLLIACGLKWWQRQNVFWGQLAFAMVLAGQVLFLAGIYDFSRNNDTTALVAVVLELVLLLLYRDTLHRLFSVLIMIGAVTFLLYDRDWPYLFHLMILLTAAGAVATWQGEFVLLTSRFHPYRIPFGYGLVLALFGLCLLALSGFYGDILWWISSTALTLVLLYLVYQIFRELPVSPGSHAAWWILATILLLGAVAYETPGIPAAVIVLLLGRWRSNGLLLGLAATFLLFFVGAYYYNLEITLLNKSYILMGSGAVLLAAWWALRRVDVGE